MLVEDGPPTVTGLPLRPDLIRAWLNRNIVLIHRRIVPSRARLREDAVYSTDTQDGSFKRYRKFTGGRMFYLSKDARQAERETTLKAIVAFMDWCDLTGGRARFSGGR
jgi:hypothetical protein